MEFVHELILPHFCFPLFVSYLLLYIERESESERKRGFLC